MTAVLLGVGGWNVAVGRSATAAPVPPSAAADVSSAFAAAARSGTRVEVASQRSEMSQTFANPNGTVTVEESTVPVRVKRTDGSWVPVDLTLRRAADGTVSPVASPVATVLSGGGSGALGTVHVGGDHFSLSWPGVLPAPVLSADTATYPDVMPGVDLRVRVDRGGFSEVLVVRTREAARNPRLAQVRFGTSGTQPANGPLFRLGTPMMWDAAPGTAPNHAVMPMRVTSSDLVMTPDPALLATGTLPLYVDPSVSAGPLHWSMIDKRFPDQSYWSYDRADHAKVGWTNDTPSSWVLYRSIFDFDTTPWRGKHVLDAVFSADLLHSYACAKSTTEVHLTGGIDQNSTWNNQSGTWGGSLSGVSNADCNDARVYTEWNGLAGVVQQSTGWANITLGLRATDEGSNAGWKKFDENSAKLTVTYNSYPNAPDHLTIDGKPCGSGAARAYVSTVGGRSPVLRAHVTDPDPGDNLNVFIGWTTKTGTEDHSWQFTVANGGYSQASAPATDFDPGVVYVYRSVDHDGKDWSPTTGGCEFVTDNAPPDKAPMVASADGRYPSDDGSAGWHDGVGKTGTFTIGSGGVDDVVSYLYGTTNPPVTAVAASAPGGGATVALTPDHAGINDLYVRSVDRAGNVGPTADYRFFVGSATPPVGAWSFSEGSGTVAHDTGTGGHDATLHGGATWTAGRVVGTGAVAFNGTDSEVVTSGPVLDTARSYTVAAWARSPRPGGVCCYTMVAEDGTSNSAFFLRYDGLDRWIFSVVAADTQPTTVVDVIATVPTPAGVWTHVAGVYDAGSHTAVLYVNGRQVASGTVPATFNATGPLTIGRDRWAGSNNTGRWIGNIADVRAWDRVVNAKEIMGLATATPVASFDFDEGAGPTAYDGTGNGHDATLTTGARWSTTGHRGDDPGALVLDGSGAAVVNGPVLRTDQSFTVAAWVKLSDTNGYHTVLSQDGTNASAFHLQYSKGQVNRWVLVCPSADSLTPSAFPMATSLAPPTLNTWVHLTGVYDASTHQLRLYVNGHLDGTANNVTVWSAQGNFNVGRGSGSSYLPGSVDDVRVYQGVLPDQAITALANS